MIITTASFKGGVAKTTTAIHLAAYLQTKGQTLLIDGDPNRSATRWAERGIANGKPLLKLPQSIESVLRQGKLQYTKVNEILKLKSVEQQQALLDEVMAANLSVEEIRQRVRELRPSKTAKEQSPNLSERLTSVTRAIKQAKVWHDPKKH